ncbi:hypothetical protein [Providencia rettgeri]|uniref:hypothetical protein n=1 Tax=Providencia rettgeri TaxID=587 RepID=UPI00384AB16A
MSNGNKKNGLCYIAIILLLFVIITWGTVYGIGASIGNFIGWDFNANSDTFFNIGVGFFLCAKVLDIIQICNEKTVNNKWFFWIAYVLEVSTPLLFVVGFNSPKDKTFIILSCIVSLLIAVIYSKKIGKIEFSKETEKSKMVTTDR